jgi:chemotaxis protein CheX
MTSTTHPTHTLQQHCPQCDALWSRMSNPKRQGKSRVYPEGGWIPLLRSAITDVFEIMLGCPVGVTDTPLPTGTTTVTAIVGLAGQITGTMNVRCDEATACSMAGHMLGIEVTPGPESHAIVCDALGEVCNMVAGAFKARIPGVEEGCSLSIPTVITGGSYEIHSISNGERVMISFTFNESPVWVSLDLHE